MHLRKDFTPVVFEQTSSISFFFELIVTKDFTPVVFEQTSSISFFFELIVTKDFTHVVVEQTSSISFSFRVKLDCSKTIAGESPCPFAPIIMLSSQLSPLFKEGIISKVPASWLQKK